MMLRTTTGWLALSVGLLSGGCGQSVMTEDANRGIDAAADPATDVGVDASAIDAPVVPIDAGTDAAAIADAGPPDTGPEPCSSEGMFRRVDCACGGMESQRCMGGAWTVAVPCDRETTCSAGAFETRDYGNCGTQQRECPDGCAWTEWEIVVPSGECHPDTTDRCDSSPPANCHCLADCTCEGIPGCPYPVGYP